MAFDDTYRESIQDKHIGNVGFTSTTKGVTNEEYVTKNPHQVTSDQIPVINVVDEYGPLVASGIAAGAVEEHVVKLTVDPTVNGNKAWEAYEDDCTTAGHSSRGHIRLDQWIRYGGTQYKLRLFEDDGTGTNYDPNKEILPSEPNFNWEYDASAGIVYFDSDPSATKTLPLWGVLYTYIGEVVKDAIDTLSSGIVSDSFAYMTDGTYTAAADGADTFTFAGAGGTVVSIDPITKSVTISGTQAEEMKDVDLTYNGTSGYWEYSGSFTSVPSDLQIYVNGNKNRSNDPEYYTASVNGGVLQVSFAYHVGADEWVNAVYNNTMMVGSAGTQDECTTCMGEWQEVTAAFSASASDRLILNTSSDGSNGTAFNVTLPASPSIGDTVSFLDGGGSCGTTNVTILRNGELIMGAASDLVVDTDNASFDLVYYSTPHGWRVVD